MKIKVTLQDARIKITEPQISDFYYIEQSGCNFFITSNNGYNGYEGAGHKTIESALKSVKSMIKNYFADRCEDAPKGW